MGVNKRKRNITGLTESHQIPLVEYIWNEEDLEPVWFIWTNYNRERTCGTYLRLYASGKITRETLTPTGEVISIGTIKPGEWEGEQ